MTQEEISIPTQFTHSLKLEDTAKGIRISVHGYANDKETVVNETFEIYLAAKKRAEKENIPIAPMEISK